MAQRLAKVFKEFRVGLVHGRIRAERDAVMRAFATTRCRSWWRPA
jgi:RecG-like helicase